MDSPVSVKDTSRFVAEHFPHSVGYVVKDIKDFTWNINNWDDLGKSASSPVFECDGHKWRIRLYPSGYDDDDDASSGGVVSVFLNHTGSSSLPKGWNVYVECAIAFSNPDDPIVYTVERASKYRFHKDNGFGFPQFEKPTTLRSIQPGHRLPIIQNNAVNITIFVRVLDDCDNVSLMSEETNLKQKTSYVGLKKKGTTSYMNTLIQVLFSIRSFRKAVYDTPIERKIPAQCATFALQRIFYDLQTSDECVSTTKLMNSFGWDEMDSFFARDIAKFRRFLQDELQSTMQGTTVDGTLHKLFHGQIETSVACLNINQEYATVDNFDEIQLEIAGAKTLRNCFIQLTKTETLTGNNKYLTHNHGLQEAERRKLFRSLPPVLFLRLKRWRYNAENDIMLKINDRLGFPFNIDLGEFMSEAADFPKPSCYKLHAVLVHSGNLASGHNYAFIKPDRNEEWLKFDDDCVTKAMEMDVIGTYGKSVNEADSGEDNLASAYMLVYICELAYNEIMAPCDEKDIPKHVEIGRFPPHEAKSHNEVTVKVITDKTFSLHQGFDLATSDSGIEFHVSRTEKYSAFKERIATHFKYQSEIQFRLWTLIAREKKAVRLGVCIPEDEKNLNIETICNSMNSLELQHELCLYIEDIPTPRKKSLLPSDSLMLFLKHFDTLKQTICGVSKIYVLKDILVSNLGPAISTLMEWMVGTSMTIYKEVKPGKVELIEPSSTVDQYEIVNGDILCFQAELTDQETEDLAKQGLCTDAIQYYDFLQNSVHVTFRPKFGELDNENPEFSLPLSKNQNYDLMSKRVGTHIDHDPHKIRFTSTKSNGSQITFNSPKKSIFEIIGHISKSNVPLVIFYEKLDVDASVAELQVKRNHEITWIGQNNKKTSTYSLLSAQTSMVNDLSMQLAGIAPIHSSGTASIRIYEVSKDRRLQKEYFGIETVENIPESAELYAEEILQEELDVNASRRTIGVFHFTKDLSRTHGIPFKFVVQEGETFEETKKRLRSRLSISDDEFLNYRFALMKPIMPLQPVYLKDEDIIYDSGPSLLGLDHDIGEGSTSGCVFLSRNTSHDTLTEDNEKDKLQSEEAV